MSLRDYNFFVVVKSINGAAYFLDNTPSRFVTKLPRELRLRGEWGVSLAEIGYPMSFIQVPIGENFVVFRRREASTDDNKIRREESQTCLLTSGNYSSLDSFLDALNNLPCFIHHLSFTQDSVGRIMVTRVCDEDVYHAFSLAPAIANILGFNRAICDGGVAVVPFQQLYVGQRPVSLSRVIPDTMSIYANICEPYITGDGQTPLLRTISVENDTHDYARTKILSFTSPRYIPLLMNNFDTIEIDIRDENRKPIAFGSGTLTVTLQFKRFD